MELVIIPDMYCKIGKLAAGCFLYYNDHGLAGRESTIVPIGAAAGAEEEIMATATAATQLHPVGEALEERPSETTSERETGTVLTEMLPSGMKCSETTSMVTSGTTSTATNETISTETITIEKVEIGKQHRRTIGTATRGTTQGMVAGRPANCNNRVMATVRRGENCCSVCLTLTECDSCFKKRQYLTLSFTQIYPVQW